VTNKNANSSGYYVPIDKVSLSASSPGEDPAGDLDAELFYPITSHPSGSPCFSYSISGGSVTNIQVDASYNWSGSAGLLFKATAAGQALTLYVTNDCFVDNNFERPGEITVSCEVVITNVIGTAGCYPADTVVQLKKGDTWITDHVGPNMGPAVADSLTRITNTLVRSTDAAEACLLLDGCWAKFCFERGGSNFSFFVTNAQIMTADGSLVSNITFNGGAKGVYMPYTGPLQTNSDWIQMWEIDRTSNYLVRFETMNMGDKDYDLFVGEQHPATGDRDIVFFKNTGDVSVAKWAPASNHWQGVGTTLDCAPAPSFGDVDNDGDFDMIVGYRGVGGVQYWKNIGDRSSMNLSCVSNFGFCSCPYGRPFLVDYNHDGLLDIVGGHESGNGYLAKNIGTPTAPDWSTVGAGSFGPAVTNEAGPGPAYAAPTFVRDDSGKACDFDGDGQIDMFVGCKDGYIFMYRNAGSLDVPSFALVTSRFGGIKHSAGYSAPAFCDIDADGRQDLFVGGGDGTIWYFHNGGGSGTGTVWDATNTTYAVVGSPGYAVPAFCNIDNDFNATAWWRSLTNINYSTWNANPPTPDAYGLARVEVGYPGFARFYSRVYDTRMGTAYFRKLNFTAFKDQAKGGDLWLDVRSGNSADLSSRPWVGPFLSGVDESLSAVTPARFVQYRAGLECGYNDVISAFTNTPTAVLRDVTIDWPAAQGLVDLEVTFGQTTNGGVVTATVDGQTMVSSVQMEMTIYKASRTGKGSIETNTASGVLEITPLNTGR